jgi:hypothetical protein
MSSHIQEGLQLFRIHARIFWQKLRWRTLVVSTPVRPASNVSISDPATARSIANPPCVITVTPTANTKGIDLQRGHILSWPPRSTRLRCSPNFLSNKDWDILYWGQGGRSLKLTVYRKLLAKSIKYVKFHTYFMAGARTQRGSFKFSKSPFIFLMTSSVTSGSTQRTAITKTRHKTNSVTTRYVQDYHIRTLRKFRVFLTNLTDILTNILDTATCINIV